MKKIESLTKEQEVRLKEKLSEWLAIGRSTHAINRVEAENSITAMYNKIGKPKPTYFWFPSPLQCMLGLAATKMMATEKPEIFKNNKANLWANLGANLEANLQDNLWANLGANLWANLWTNLRTNLRTNLEANLRTNLEANLEANLQDNLWANLEDNLRTNLEANLGANLGANLRTNLRTNLEDNLEANLQDNLWANLEDNLEANLWDNLRTNPWANLQDNLQDNLEANLRTNLEANLRTNLGTNLGANLDWKYFAGNLWCAWEVFYDFCNEIGVPYSKEDRHLLDMWLVQSRNCHFWWPLEGTVFLSERPVSIKVDNMGRLHCEDDAAMYYQDGYGLYMWHGVKIPKYIVENPEQITIDRIEAEYNAEVRRVMLIKYGMARYLEDRGAKSIDKDRDTKGERILYEIKDAMGVIKLIKLENSTPEQDGSKKFYTFRVHPDVKTCQEAVSYLYSMESDKYRPQVES